jgi:hypothetical protein
MKRIDRRILFLLMAAGVAIPLLFRPTLTVHPSPIVSRVFDKIESLPEGSKILMSFDYGPSTVPENQPMAEAIARHVLRRRLKLYMVSAWTTGQAQADLLIESVMRTDFTDRVYGEDWVHLGYKAGNQGMINAIFGAMRNLYTTDAAGTNVDAIPMMRDVQSLRDMDLIVDIASGFPGVKEWIQFAGDPGNIPVAGGVTAVEALLLYPYYPRQLLGLMGGLQGAAEYEAALVAKYPEYRDDSKALQIMGPQYVAHLLIVVFILIGNATYFAERRRQKRGRIAGGRS